MRLLPVLTPSCLVLSVSVAAHASTLTELPPDPQQIYGGEAVDECDWPTTVYMDGCTGTLVSPEVVIFAAHCMFFVGGQGPAFAEFGETDSNFVRQVPTQSCTMFPGWFPDDSGFGSDVAFCVLAEPVTDVPIVPPLMGCETEILQPGQEITLVGYGETEFGVTGTKYAVQTTVNGMEGSSEIIVGGGGTSSCYGDSGGPAYVQLEDGSWRVFGITSRGTSMNCNNPSIYGLIHAHAQWFEDTSGFDITPCHDADGTWNPGEGCTEFPLDPGTGTATWAMACAEAELSGPSSTCGEPFDDGSGSTGTTGDPGTTGDDPDGTGTDDTGTGGGTGLPGGTAGDESTSGTPGDGTTSGGPSQDDDGEDTVITCTCRTNAPAPTAAWLLLPALALFRRRRT